MNRLGNAWPVGAFDWSSLGQAGKVRGKRELKCRPIMKRKHLRFGEGFRVALGNRRAQAAEMVLEPGDSEGGPDNRHRGSDQWLYVVSGSGAATVNGKRYPLRTG